MKTRGLLRGVLGAITRENQQAVKQAELGRERGAGGPLLPLKRLQSPSRRRRA